MRRDDLRFAVAAREDGLRRVRRLTFRIGAAGLAWLGRDRGRLQPPVRLRRGQRPGPGQRNRPERGQRGGHRRLPVRRQSGRRQCGRGQQPAGHRAAGRYPVRRWLAAGPGAERGPGPGAGPGSLRRILTSSPPEDGGFQPLMSWSGGKVLRFAVRPPTQRLASPRSHRMPCGDVPGRVHVSVSGISAGPAGEDGLALTRLRIHGPARTAPLRGVRGIYPLDPVWGLVLQSAQQQPPAVDQDAAVQARFLPDVAPRLRDAAPCRPGHAAHIQVLHPDHVEPSGQAGGGLLDPVFSSVSLTGSQLRDRGPDLSAPVRALPGPRQLALQSPQPHPLALTQAGAAQQFSCGQGSRHRHTAVNARDLAGSRAGHGLGDDCECNVPAARAVESDAVRLRSGTQLGTSGTAPTRPSAPTPRRYDGTAVVCERA